MNLCGGIVNVGDSEQLLLEIPDEKFQLTPRRKATSSVPGRRNKVELGPLDTERRTPSSTDRRSSVRPLSTTSGNRSRASPSPLAVPSPTFLNPLSKDDLRKSMNRQRPVAGPPPHATKVHSSGLTKKLESGYNVTLLADDGQKILMVLDVNAEKTHLRIRPREENSSDNENDGLKSNIADILLKVTDITRLEVGREKQSRKSSLTPRQVKSFSIVMRKPIGDSNTFNFDADTPSDRDFIIAESSRSSK